MVKEKGFRHFFLGNRKSSAAPTSVPLKLRPSRGPGLSWTGGGASFIPSVISTSVGNNNFFFFISFFCWKFNRKIVNIECFFFHFPMMIWFGGNLGLRWPKEWQYCYNKERVGCKGNCIPLPRSKDMPPNRIEEWWWNMAGRWNGSTNYGAAIMYVLYQISYSSFFSIVVHF